MNSGVGHWRYLKQFLQHGSAYLSATSFVLVLAFPVFWEVSDYISPFLYIGGVAAFYFAGYKTWKESLPPDQEAPLRLKADKGTVEYSYGNGNIFWTSKLSVRISVSNNTDKSITLDNLTVKLKKDLAWIKLKDRPDLLLGSGGSVGSYVDIGPKESRNLYMNLNGEGSIEDRVKLARALREDPIFSATLAAEYFLEGERSAIEVDFEYDAEKLINRMRDSWSRSSSRDAIKELDITK